MKEKTAEQIHCPHCNSTQLTANKKGFSGTKAAAGALLTGGIGLLAGTIGSNKIRITCLNCGHVFKPGEHLKKQTTQATSKINQPTQPASAGAVFLGLLIIAIIAFLISRC